MATTITKGYHLFTENLNDTEKANWEERINTMFLHNAHRLMKKNGEDWFINISKSDKIKWINMPQGYIAYEISDNDIHILHTLVDKPHRGKGIFGIMLNELEQSYCKSCVNKIYLEVPAEYNYKFGEVRGIVFKQRLNLYQKHGFKIVDERDNFINMIKDL